MNLSHLPNLQQRPRCAVSKHALPTRLETTTTARKLDTKRLAAFRAAVWKRDQGLCRICGRQVKRTLNLEPLRGEVHHLKGRNVAPEDRYVVSKALLLCLACHGRAGRKEVKVPTP